MRTAYRVLAYLLALSVAVQASLIRVRRLRSDFLCTHGS
jgi:hypothetical protein